MSKITTHVLDTSLGKPAAGIPVLLEKREGGGWFEVSASLHSTDTKRQERVQDAPGDWTEIARGCSDADGRCGNLIEDAGQGEYRLVLQVGEYFARAKRQSLYPEISITFRCDGEAHYHLPVLLSDSSYTTYRGS